MIKRWLELSRSRMSFKHAVLTPSQVSYLQGNIWTWFHLRLLMVQDEILVDLGAGLLTTICLEARRFSDIFQYTGVDDAIFKEASAL